ncbi:MAG: hypothetical protein NTX15_05095 [Candidatus Kapabacteria bacterium]|nr:hypothetical protein [Candidatus Kapabacteria bacterium]
MLRIACILLFCLCGPAVGFAQSIQLSNWRTLSSLTTVRSADLDTTGRIWAATSGGVLVYDRRSETTIEYRNVNALQTLDCTALMCDRARGVVYVGQYDGALDIADSNGSWTNVSDIRRATQYTRRRINDFATRGDTLFIATDFGVVLYNLKNQTFIETVDRIGDLQEKTKVSGVCILRDTVWLSTDSGVAHAPLAVETLRLPSVWTILDTTSGLPATKVNAIQSNGTTIAISTDYGAATWDGIRFVVRIGTSTPITGLSYSGQRLSISTATELRTLDGPVPIVWPGEIIGHIWQKASGEDLLVSFVRDQALGYVNGSALTMIAVNSPISNQFANMSIDTRGGLWVATDVDPPRTGQGVSYFSGSTWRNINRTTQPLLGSNACYKVSSLADGSTWIGTWGGGTLRCLPTDTGLVYEKYNQNNSSLAGIVQDPAYVLVAEVAMDRFGRRWLLNEQAADRLLATLDEGSWTSSPNCSDPRSTIFRTLAIDANGGVWTGSPTGSGVVAYNDRNTPDRDDDICNVVRTSNTQLPDNVVSCIRADRFGAIWIGTAKGVAVISSPGTLSNTSVPFVRRISALSNAVVNDIYVDALNYKWIATTGGVFVLNEDGTEVISTITKSNTPLLDDNIRTVAVDALSGLAYFGTTNGCSVAQTSSLRPLDAFSIKVYPQPFKPTQGGLVVIDGLAPDADIRIMTAGGILVSAMQARGRQALWDGRDVNGTVVSPGVYIVSATSASTNTSAVGKIAVTR